METFSFSPPTKLADEGKWLLAVTSFEATNSVFKLTDRNNSFSTSSPGYWLPKAADETFNKLQTTNKLIF